MKKRDLSIWLKISFGSAMVFITMSFGSIFFGPGLTEVVPISAFVNGNFPDVNLDAEPYEVAYPNIRFDWPLTFTIVPGQTRVVVGQLDGKIYWMDDNQTTTTKNFLVDFSDEVGDAVTPNLEVWDGGLLGLEIHPNFGAVGNNYIYIYYTTESETGDDTLNSGGNGTFGCNLANFHGNYLHLDRFEVDPLNMTFISNSRKRMMRRRMLNTTHRGGAMEFGNDGFLYIATGEQGRAINAQNIIDNLDGGVLRIDVDMDGSKSHAPIRTMPDDAGQDDEITGNLYWIPNDNPFLSTSGDNFEEYYTIGNRSPHRMSKDSQTGNLYIGEVGQSTHDEINIVSKGGNYGWPVWEGEVPGPFNQCYIEMLNDMEHQVPLTAFVRDDAKSIIGGQVYRGNEFATYNGKYISADWLTQKIFSVDILDGSYVTLGTLPKRPISFGEGTDGNIYYLLQGNNVQLLRFVAPSIPTGMPQLLSETGAFSDLSNLTVTDGFVPYEMIDAFWSDGASKKRWMAIPNNGTHNSPQEQIQFSEDGNWIFPIGSVLIKHFDYPVDENNPEVTKKIETRFSIKNSDDNWTFLSYKWNSTQTEANLVNMTTGGDEPIVITEINGGTRTEIWRFPSTNECLNCHNDASQGTLGPRTRYLNSEFDYSTHAMNGVQANQLVTLSHLGILDRTITDVDTPNFITHSSIDDNNANIEDKARSYLDLNCAYCHQPANGIRAEFDLRLFNSLEETGLLTAGVGETVEEIGSDQKIIYPGDASKSQIFHRANSVDSGTMMPPLAKNQIDEKGVALLQQWINQLEELPISDSFNSPDSSINLALSDDAVLGGSVVGGRGTMEAILYDPVTDDYYMPTRFNEYGVVYNVNLGRPGAEDGFLWQVDWSAAKRVNYITFGGTYPNQPQPNSMWRISYLRNGTWTVLEEGKGGWIDSGIYEWGGPDQYPIEVEALRVQVYSDGNNDLVSIHLRGRGGISQYVDESGTATKATLIQYLPGDHGPDTVAPVITLNGANPQVIELGDGYTELGATTDDGSPVNIDSSSFFDAVGSYDIVYSSTDGTNEAEDVIRVVNVIRSLDATAPVITLNGANPQVIELGDGYTELGATTDDGSPVSIDSSLFVDAVGNYDIVYSSTDGTNEADEVVRRVDVVEILTDFNSPDSSINLALSDDAVLGGSVTGGRGTMEAILYDPVANDYYTPTRYNEYGVAYNVNLGRPGADDGFLWQVDWSAAKRVNYITFGGTYPNQPQPNSMWRVSYLRNGTWTVLEGGKGGWIDSGIYEWGGPGQYPIEAEALRVQVYSDGNNHLVSIHLRGRGGISTYNDDSGTATKATLIQYLPGDHGPDTVAPVITLNGANPQVIELGDGYTELGATTDDGSPVNIDSSSFFDAVGSYDIVYSSTDGTNEAEELIRRVDVVETLTDFNAPDSDVNLALLEDAVLGGSVTGGRGTMEAILYDPVADDYYTPTRFNEYGVGRYDNLGRPGADDGFLWQVDWSAAKRVNYITFGGTYPNQPQPNSMWRISYLRNGTWTVLEEGKGGWIDSGIYEWGGPGQYPIEAEALRVQVYSDGNNDLVSIHLRGRGGISQYVDDSGTATKATLIQYLPVSSQTSKSIGGHINNMIIYPNPADIETTLSFDQPTTVGTIQIFDVTGRLVQTINGGLIDERGAPVNVQEMPDGVYFVKTTDASGIEFQQQMLIQRQ
ncbi:PQQ-dependent sugar dehydrogenase [Maribacter sp. BPC-D8]|uniref:PQQ-dependent sugar dehydrogenase n=1 Tax=Maribacter sp. BPC-D8 TaxID=3053613 RepID=UPI002B48AE16|nr:PQQ-dependent sugar dehydrogenase [Maribacter sp. BPC-D8]WRI29934.1 PQQ-dependent sugar dehydrogenase [Maribacter sp. BPC-D8]